MSKKHILVVGDVMIDRYTHVKTERFAPEAPIPVWDAVGEENRLGGAGNVAANIKALGKEDVEVYLLGVLGSSEEMTNLISGHKIIRSYAPSAGDVMVKHRFVSKGEIIFRCDNFLKFSDRDVRLMEWMFANSGLSNNSFDAVVFSDYNKGTITPEFMSLFRERFTKNTRRFCPLIVDSKRPDLEIFHGFDVLKLNQHEWEVAFSRNTNVLNKFHNVVVTRGAEGAELRVDGKPSRLFPTEKVETVRDVTGCGDTHTAALTYALTMAGSTMETAIGFANRASRNVVQKFGTSVVDRSSLEVGYDL